MPAAGQRSGRYLSLRTHLLILVVGTLLPALTVAALLIKRVVDDNRAAVGNELITTARGQAAAIDRELSATIRSLQTLGLSDRLTSGDLAAFREEAIKLLHEQPMWSAVVLSRPDGQQVVSSVAPPGEPLPAAAKPDALAHVIATGAPVIGDFDTGDIVKQPGFAVHAPVTRNGQVVYVLSALITSSAFSEVLRREAKVSDEWVRGIVDGNGVLVARSRDPERFVGQKGTESFLERYSKGDEEVYRDVALDGTAVYGAFSRAPFSRWIGGVAVPASVVDAGFNRSMTVLGVIGVLLLGVGGVAAFVISRRIARDISGVAEGAQALARGEQPRLPTSTVLEVHQLSKALEQARRLLEVRERERDEQFARADQARRDAESADHAKDDFLAMLGHELRNPLAPALTALQLVRRRHAGLAIRELDVIERQIEHMARLVDDLLEVSRLRRQAITLKEETFDLREAVERAAEMTAPLYTERRHTLEVRLPDPLLVAGDLVRMSQVFANLLTNAAKYTDPGGHVEVSAAIDDDTIIVDCRDNGIGMAPELIPRVFDLFVQGAPDFNRHEGGLGLGLALVRTLVEQHGGTIEAESDGPGRGSTFVVRLPCAAVVT